MRLDLPGFADSYCTYVDVCGDIAKPSAQIVSNLFGKRKDVDLTIGYRSSQGDARARFSAFPPDDDYPSLHFHITIAPTSFFRSTPPKATHKRVDFDQKVDRLRSTDVVVRTRAYWRVAKARLKSDRQYPWAPDVRTGFGGVSMTLVGAEFEISGGRIEFFSWRWAPPPSVAGKKAQEGSSSKRNRELSLYTRGASRNTRFGPRFISEELHRAESDLRTAILGERLETES